MLWGRKKTLAWEQSLKEFAPSQLLCYLQGLSQSKTLQYILVSSLISCVWYVRSWSRRDSCYLVVSYIYYRTKRWGEGELGESHRRCLPELQTLLLIWFLLTWYKHLPTLVCDLVYLTPNVCDRGETSVSQKPGMIWPAKNNSKDGLQITFVVTCIAVPWVIA